LISFTETETLISILMKWRHKLAKTHYKWRAGWEGACIILPGRRRRSCATDRR